MRRAWPRCLVIAAALACLAGCGRAGVQDGHAFTGDFPVSTGDKPILPGSEIGLLDVFLSNGSDSTVVLTSVGVRGPGIGTAIRPVEIKIAPLRFGRHRYERNATPSSLYITDPPVLMYGRGCHRQELFPVRGFKMTPGSQARVWIVLRGLRPGRWVIPRHVIYYRIGGTRYQEAIPLREHGSVATHAPTFPPDPAVTPCVGPEHARYLAGDAPRHRG
jgi:hypothetical protein